MGITSSDNTKGFSYIGLTIILATVLMISAGLVYGQYTNSLEKKVDARNDMIDQRLDHENTDMNISDAIDNNTTVDITFENTGDTTIHSEELTILLDDNFMPDSEITYGADIIQPGESITIKVTYNNEDNVKIIHESENTASASVTQGQGQGP